jgi:hypothetical protein
MNESSEPSQRSRFRVASASTIALLAFVLNLATATAASAVPSNDNWESPTPVCSGASRVSSTVDCSFSADNQGGATIQDGEFWDGQTVWYSLNSTSRCNTGLLE